jgi:hypothetical protein
MEQGANLDQVLRSAAALPDCTVGIRSGQVAGPIRIGPDGSVALTRPCSSNRELATGGKVWLQRSDGPLPQDEILLERLAIAYASLTAREASSLPRMGDPALIELVISGEAGVAERSRALSLLGSRPIRGSRSPT